jgi:methylase of polypeptide subunit release factors
VTAERRQLPKEVATELARLHDLIAEERPQPPDDEIRRIVHRLLFLCVLERMGVATDDVPVLAEVADRLKGAALRRALARARAAKGRWPEAVLTAAGFGTVHELYLATRERKRSGAYYTPAPLVEYLVEQALDRLLGPPVALRRGELQGWRILDPACGGGRFLVGTLGRLLDWYREAWGTDELSRTECLAVVRYHVYGLDLDPLAVDAARIALALMISGGAHGTAVDPGELAQNVVVGDAFRLEARDVERQLAFDVDEVLLPAALEPPFDLVIGNPPYVSFSGRQAERSVRSPRVDLTPGAGKRWPALHSDFVEHAAEHLVRRLVAFVVPEQLGHLDSYEPVRKAISRRAGLVHVRYWGEGVFPGVVSPILTFVADREHSGRTSIESTDGERTLRRIRGGARWHAVKSERLLERLLEQGESLGRLVGDPGVHTGNCAAMLVFSRDEAPAGAVPVLEGRHIARYACKQTDRYLRLDYEPAEGEYFRIGAEDRYAAASFLIRQTAGYPIVGPRRGALYFRNSLLALSKPDDFDVRFLVGLLNSSLMRIVYRLLVPESHQRTFPQMKVSSLRSLPIKRLARGSASDRGDHDRVVALVSRLLELGGDGSSTTEDERLALEDELDALVFELYGVTEAERRVLLAQDPLLAGRADLAAA